MHNLGKKILLFIILILYFTSLKADEAKDFQIEDISLMDSALNHYSIKEIKKDPRATIYKDKAFFTISFESASSNYDKIKLGLKSNDKNYVIFGLTGQKNFNNLVSECYKSQDDIIEEMKSLFTKSEIIGPVFKKFSYDEDGSSRQIYFKLPKGDFIGVQCKKYGKKIKNQRGYLDNLTVSIFSKEYNYWLVNVAFK